MPIFLAMTVYIYIYIYIYICVCVCIFNLIMITSQKLSSSHYNAIKVQDVFFPWHIVLSTTEKFFFKMFKTIMFHVVYV